MEENILQDCRNHRYGRVNDGDNVDPDWKPEENVERSKPRVISPTTAQIILSMRNANRSAKSIRAQYRWYERSHLSRIKKIVQSETVEKSNAKDNRAPQVEKSEMLDGRVVSVKTAQNILSMVNANKTAKSVRGKYRWYQSKHLPRIKEIALGGTDEVSDSQGQ